MPPPFGVGIQSGAMDSAGRRFCTELSHLRPNYLTLLLYFACHSVKASDPHRAQGQLVAGSRAPAMRIDRFSFTTRRLSQSTSDGASTDSRSAPALLLDGVESLLQTSVKHSHVLVASLSFSGVRFLPGGVETSAD